jgi:hypothetical protein
VAKTAKVRMRVDEKNQIIRQYIEGIVTEEDAVHVSSMTASLAQGLKKPDKVKILVVTERYGKTTPKARRHLMQDMNRPELYKMAIVGSNPYARAFINLYLLVTRSKKVKTFLREQDAMEWLKD